MPTTWIAGLPTLLLLAPAQGAPGEFQASPSRGTVLGFHGVGSSKEALLEHGLDRLCALGYHALFLDAAWHGERRLPDVDAFVLQHGPRDYLWGSLRETALGVPLLLDALEREGHGPFYALGHSMGGHLTHHLLAVEPRLQGGAILSGSSHWSPEEARDPRLRAWLEENLPAQRAAQVAPRPLALVHGTGDPTVPPGEAKRAFDALLPHYSGAGAVNALELALLEREGHELSPALVGRALHFFEHLPRPRPPAHTAGSAGG